MVYEGTGGGREDGGRESAKIRDEMRCCRCLS